MQPTQKIDPRATQVNKLSVINKKLCYDGEACENVVSQSQGMKNFVKYLLKNYPNGAVLIAHNGNRFDFRLLRRNLEKYKCGFSKDYPIHCIDSIKIFKHHFPCLGTYSQPSLLERFAGSENISDAHEAVGDCINLKNAIKVAAREKRMSIAQFIGNSTDLTDL